MKTWCFSAMLTGLLLTAFGVQAEPLAVGSLDEVEAFARAHSPLMDAIRAEGEAATEEVRQSVVGRNPYLAFEQEITGNEMERSFTLEKEFRTPWSYNKQRQWLNAEVTGLNARTNRMVEETITDLKIQYVELAITQSYLQQLDNLVVLLDSLRTVISIRTVEGFESIIDAQLISSSLADLRARTTLLKHGFYAQRATWQLDMGLDTGATAESELLIPDLAIVDLSEVELLAALEDGPRWREIAAVGIAHHKRLDVERAAWLPTLGIGGGYKQSENGDARYLLGFSIPLPVLDHNSHAIHAAEAEVKLAAFEISREQLHLQVTLESQIKVLLELQSVLSDFPIPGESLSVLFASLEEGWISIPAALSSLQGILEADKRRGELVLSWFTTLFELELLTATDFYKPVKSTVGDR